MPFAIVSDPVPLHQDERGVIRVRATRVPHGGIGVEGNRARPRQRVRAGAARGTEALATDETQIEHR